MIYGLGKESTNEEVAYLSHLYRAFYYFVVGLDKVEIIDYYMDKVGKIKNYII